MAGGLVNYQISKEQMLLNAAIVAEARGDFTMAVTYLKALANLQKIQLDRMPITDPMSVTGQRNLKDYYARSLQKLMGETHEQIDQVRKSYSSPFTIKSSQS